MTHAMCKLVEIRDLVVLCQWEKGVPADDPSKGLRWLSKAQLATEGLSSVMRKVMAAATVSCSVLHS